MKQIPLTQGKFTLVDDQDYEWLSQFQWCYHKGYAVRRVGRRNMFMHRIIMNTPPGMHTDHVDRNKLNNQRANLRVCTEQQNKWNYGALKSKRTSKYKGVSFVKVAGKTPTSHPILYFKVTIRVHGRSKSKYFPPTAEGEVLAAKQYNSWAREAFGEYAYQNNV